MVRRLIVPRLAGAEIPAGDAPAKSRMVDPPSVTSLRMAYGVGTHREQVPDDDTFRPTYHLEIPVFSLGGLDPDGVYEFDAGRLFETIERRALRRKWAMRLEIELQQSADNVAGADIYVDTPFADDDPSSPSMAVAGTTGRGTVLPGGGRTVVLATSLVHDAKRVSRLSGIYSIQLRDADPRTEDKPTVASLSRGINIDLTRFEFEG